MIIRQADESDMPTLMQIEEECFGAEKFSTETVRAFVERDDTAVLVALEDVRIVGSAMCIVSELRREGKIASVAVRKDARGRGVGGRLVDGCEEFFTMLGALKHSLEVETTNEHAIDLYTHRGYEVVAMIADFYGSGRDAYYMEKQVGPKGNDVKVRSA